MDADLPSHKAKLHCVLARSVLLVRQAFRQRHHWYLQRFHFLQLEQQHCLATVTTLLCLLGLANSSYYCQRGGTQVLPESITLGGTRTPIQNLQLVRFLYGTNRSGNTMGDCRLGHLLLDLVLPCKFTTRQ